jgi:hypothetical protein
VIWVDIPSLAISRAEQRYERLGIERVRFSSGEFTAVLTTDADGLVDAYDGLFRRIARR